MKKITEFVCGNRYMFDFDICSVKKGWAQIDTEQDASYYGNWAHPTNFEIITYAEGDVIIKKEMSKAKFLYEIKYLLEWHRKNGYGGVIDPAFNEKAWEDLGLQKYLVKGH